MKILSIFFNYTSYHLLNYIFTALLLIIYYRSVAKKIQRLGSYYLAFREYTQNSHIMLKKIDPTLLMSFEFVAMLMLAFPIYVRFASLMVVFIQLVYILLMFSGEKNTTDMNCGCHVTLPRNVDVTVVLKNFLILFLGLLNFLIFIYNN